MQFQLIFRAVLLSLIFYNASAKEYPPKFCAECEEEVWEEVPCDSIFSTTTTPATPVTPSTPAVSTATTPVLIPSTIISSTTPSTTTITTTTTTATPPTLKYSPTAYSNSPIYTKLSNAIASTRRPPIFTKRYPLTSSRPLTSTPSTTVKPTTTAIESNDAYKKCYCECKSGCKEFCRQVVVYPDANKQFTQISKTTSPVDNGHIEVKHVHERNWIPALDAYGNNRRINTDQYYQPYHIPSAQQQPHSPQTMFVENNMAYNGASAVPIYNSLNSRPNYEHQHNADSLGLSFDELSKLLHSDHAYSSVIPEISQVNYQNAYSNSQPVAHLPNRPQVYSPSQNIISLGVKTTSSGDGSASAFAGSPVDYKTSHSNTYSKQIDQNPYIRPNPAPAPIIHNPEPTSSPIPCAPNYGRNSIPKHNLPPADHHLDAYLRELLYSHPPTKAREEYSIPQ